MASIQSQLVKFWFKRQNVFGVGNYDPQGLRARVEQVSFGSKPHRRVHILPVEADSVASEWLIPEQATQDHALLYIHGGAWFMCSTKTHRGLVSYLANASGIRALSINYRLAPENPFPAGLEDCLTAYEWLLNHGFPSKNVIVAGDSAGGNLALALLVALRDSGKPLPAGAVALSPPTDLAGTGESYKTRLRLDPILSGTGNTTIIKDYITSHDPRTPLISPLYADLTGLPPLLLHVGDHEILLDDTVRFGDRALAAGVEVETVVWPEMFHVFQLFVPIMPEANKAVSQIASFIRLRLGILPASRGAA